MCAAAASSESWKLDASIAAASMCHELAELERSNNRGEPDWRTTAFASPSRIAIARTSASRVWSRIVTRRSYCTTLELLCDVEHALQRDAGPLRRLIVDDDLVDHISAHQ